mmetsp:Transcript_8868/g.14856  ORF Transcript_8868/g.14856 Transcript_8868/m.14856 type:complete len:200 (+) Transcript_8868:2325-2924(+)
MQKTSGSLARTCWSIRSPPEGPPPPLSTFQAASHGMACETATDSPHLTLTALMHLLAPSLSSSVVDRCCLGKCGCAAQARPWCVTHTHSWWPLTRLAVQRDSCTSTQEMATTTERGTTISANTLSMQMCSQALLCTQARNSLRQTCSSVSSCLGWPCQSGWSSKLQERCMSSLSTNRRVPDGSWCASRPCQWSPIGPSH